uniref:hypothetical protein n=1 Tax=uncultured Kiloniella sp. TaxID=1133091 RepID=UPI002628113A
MKDLEIKAIIRAVDEATGPIKKITRSVERMGKSVSNIGRKMTIGISAPLAAIGTLGVKSFGDWDESMRNVSTLVDTNIEDMGKLSSEAMKIAKDIPRPLNETAAALY